MSALRGCQALPLPRASGNLRRMPPPNVFLGLGSNLGDREANLVGAERELERRGFRVEARSSTYLTEPKDAPSQGWFLNAVLGGTTALSPEELMAACLEAEGPQAEGQLLHRGAELRGADGAPGPVLLVEQVLRLLVSEGAVEEVAEGARRRLTCAARGRSHEAVW